VPKVGRQYRRFAHKKLLAFRAAAVGNDELLRRLDQLEERIAFHAESERSRLAKKHKGVPSKPLTTEPVPQVTAPVDIWRKMLAEQQEKQNETQR
jgi:hypothetical protein